MAQKKPTKRTPAKKSTAKRKPAVKTREIAFSVGLFDRTLISFSVKVSTTGPSKSKTKAKKKPAKTKSVKQPLLRDQRSLATLSLLAVGLIGPLFFTYQLVFASPSERPLQEVSASAVQPYQPKSLNKSDAATLRIPSIGVEAGVIQIGKSADGTIESPRVYDQVGQYSLGPTPGEIGPSIIVGHVDSLTGPAIFWRLRELTPGQEIDVTRQDGSVAKFKIDRLAEYSQNDFPTDQVYGNTGNAELRLITCSGTFNVFTGKYSNNTVVYASLI